MKIYFYLGVGIIITLIVTLFGYSVYLNNRGENDIIERMANQHLPLTGTTVQERDLMPIVELELVNLYSNKMTDVVALENGRVVRAFVEKNGHDWDVKVVYDNGAGITGWAWISSEYIP